MRVEVERNGLDTAPAFDRDGRWPIESLFCAFEQLCFHGWSQELITTQDGVWPIVAYISHPRLTEPRKSLYVLSGVHGEEPAPPIAVAREIGTLIDVAKYMPVVLLPMLNPKGYSRDWRYENEYRDYNKGKSVTDSEDLLSYFRVPNMTGPESSVTARSVRSWILKTGKQYLPHIVFNHHEDEFAPFIDDPQSFHTYIYVYGRETSIPIANRVTDLLKEHRMPIATTGTTRFGETITNGVVFNNNDGSIDELFASPVYFEDGVVKQKYPASAVIVVETTILPNGAIPLSVREDAHRDIIRHYGEFLAE